MCCVMATSDVCAWVAYLDEVVAALQDRDVPVETGFISLTHPAGRTLTITFGPSPTGLSGATLCWQPATGWSLTTQQTRPRQWILPPDIRPHPDEVASAVEALVTFLRTPPVQTVAEQPSSGSTPDHALVTLFTGLP
jgi:hypothetical protein